MNKIFVKIVSLFIILSSVQCCFAHCHKSFPTTKEQNQIDKIITERLNLSKEQINYLQKSKSKNRKEIEAVVKKMEAKRDEIRNVYMLGLPKFQSDLRSAPQKAELVVLKQNVKKIREAQRKDFESILTPEQKVEFEKLRKELQTKKHRI